MSIKFGTDGWRAVIGEDFTFDNVRLVAQAIAEYVKTQGGKRVSVGYDTRFLGSKFAEAVACVMAANGIKVLLSDGPTSTPALSLSIKQNKLIGGVMVTASHNPPQYSGIKYKADYAGPAEPEIIAKIEGFLGKTEIKNTDAEGAEKTGQIKKADLNGPHLKFLKSYLDVEVLKKAKFNILADVMYGAGLNPGFNGTAPEPIERNLKELIASVKKEKCDIGLATDGDVDRIGAISPDGEFITSSQIISLLIVHFVEDKKWKGAIAKTISGSFLIDEIAKAFKLKLHETPVGFKYICKLMQTDDILIGGEESGGIGFKNYVPERDGTLAGLLIVEMMAQRGQSIKEILKDIEKRFGKFCSDRLDIEFPNEKKPALFEGLKNNPPKEMLGSKIVDIKTWDGVKYICADKSWLLFRASGTEPILRIYAEADSKPKLNKILEFGRGIALKNGPSPSRGGQLGKQEGRGG
ncbi:MAG: phosphoglucomutase/phosphomannomutase family protein [Candidatus Omnitrophica bacterium]|nr:phosphoglucomutase/phosphomannomutase family protein [Candidatus Omnitrophota bacterium]